VTPRRGGDEPTPLGDALAALGKELGIGSGDAAYQLTRRWSEVAGPDVAEHARPGAVRDGVLTVVVDEAVWATQLRYLEAVIVERAGAVVGPDVVRSVRVRVVAPGTREDL
jgi:predicted nucleic acid-binding Zn ribbon protein